MTNTSDLDLNLAAAWAARMRELFEGGGEDDRTASSWHLFAAPHPERSHEETTWAELAQVFRELLARHSARGASEWLDACLARQANWPGAEEALAIWCTSQEVSSAERFLVYLRYRAEQEAAPVTGAVGMRDESDYLTQEGVGERILALRNERGVSQRRLADAVGVDPSAMSRIESGQRGLAVGELVAIAEFFGVPTDALLRREVDSAPLFRNEGGEGEASEALAAFEAIIDDFFAFEAAARA